MRKLAALLLLAVLPSWGLSTKAKRRLTFAAVAVAQILDVHSSLGRREANPLLRGPDGRFSVGRGVGVKLGVLAGLWAAQELYPSQEWNWVNLGYAGATTAIAIRNYRLPAPKTTPPAIQPGTLPGSP
ncbi:MAG: hypothetical protein RMK57_04885 [Bryobacterales bacterium]|nr:hypothetical protein [Bryobacteraceae bacterium]MDW8353848.1 hypothetical protein [Bryobacterales bacterium]